MTQQAREAAPPGSSVPIVPYLRLPEKEGEKAYLSGHKCPECGAVYLEARLACAKCRFVGEFKEARLSDEGELWTWTIVHMSKPELKVPFIAGIVDLKDGISVQANIEGVDPDPEKIKFGMKLKMHTDTAFTDQEGRKVIRYVFRPA